MFCSNPTRCVKCGLPHRSNECAMKPDEQPKCIFCGENHVSSYRGCKEYQRRFERKKSQPQQQVPTFNEENFPNKLQAATPRNVPLTLYSEKLKSNIPQPPENLQDAVSWIKDEKINAFLSTVISIIGRIKQAKTSAEKLQYGFEAAMTLIKFAEDEN
ncbi:hypothetical protein X975_00862, partial [Stegodyphus mimosarum]